MLPSLSDGIRYNPYNKGLCKKNIKVVVVFIHINKIRMTESSWPPLPLQSMLMKPCPVYGPGRQCWIIVMLTLGSEAV